MRKLIVSNMMTLDGFYSGTDGEIPSLFDYYPEGDHSAQLFDVYQLERARAADIMLLNGHKEFKANHEYWTSVLDSPNVSSVRREFARRMKAIDKVAISDVLTPDDLGDWDNTRIYKRDDAVWEIAALKAQADGEIMLFGGRTLWHHLMANDLVDELHIATFPMIAGGGKPLFDGQPGVTLRLLSSRTWQGSGIVVNAYAVSRPPTSGV